MRHKAGINIIDKSCHTPIYYAITSNNKELLKYMVEHGANINIADKERKTSIYHAIESGDAEMVKYLVRNGAIVDKVTDINSNTPLHWAMVYENIEMIKCLIEEGKNDINAKNRNGYSPLDLISECKDQKIVQYLMLKKQLQNLNEANRSIEQVESTQYHYKLK